LKKGDPLILFIFILWGCRGEEAKPYNKVKLPGEMAFVRQPNILYHYSRGVLSNNILTDIDNQSLLTVSWLGASDTLVGRAYVHFSQADKKIILQRLILLDTKGRRIGRLLLETRKGESIGTCYSSHSGKQIAVEVTEGNKPNGRYEKASIRILNSIRLNDIKNRLVITFDSTLFVDLREWPWSKDDSKIVYSTWQPWSESNDYSKVGVFIYDLDRNRQIQIDSDGHYAIWSQNGRLLAYIKNNSVWIYDLIGRERQLFYKAKFLEDLSAIHWSPDGIYLRIQGWRYRSLGYLFEKPIDRLLTIEDGEEVSFEQIGGGSYSWR